MSPGGARSHGLDASSQAGLRAAQGAGIPARGCSPVRPSPAPVLRLRRPSTRAGLSDPSPSGPRGRPACPLCQCHFGVWVSVLPAPTFTILPEAAAVAPLGPGGLLLPHPVLGPPWRASWGGSRHGRSQPGPRLRRPPRPPTRAPARRSPAEPSRTAQLRASPATISLFYNSVPRHLQNPAPSSSGLTAPLNFKQTPQSGPPGRATFRTRLTARPPGPPGPHVVESASRRALPGRPLMQVPPVLAAQGSAAAGTREGPGRPETRGEGGCAASTRGPRAGTAWPGEPAVGRAHGASLALPLVLPE